MQKTFFLVVAVLMAFQSSYADITPGLPAGLRGVVGLQPGDYKFYDQAQLQTEYLKLFGKRQQAQKEYVEKVVGSLNAQFNLILDSTVYNSQGLQTLASKSLAGGGSGIAWDDYLVAVNNYNKEKTKYLLLLTSITQLPGAIQSNTTVSADGSGVVQLPGLLSGSSVDFSALIETYRSNLERLDLKLSQLTFIVNTEQDGVQQVRGLEYVPSVAYSPERMAALSLQVAEARAASSKENTKYRMALDATRRFTQSLASTFTIEYGAKQSYRVDRNDMVQRREQMLANVVQLFFTRSMLRTAYGLPLGTFNLRYDMSRFHIDFLKSAKDIVQFVDETVWDSVKMYQTQNAVYESLNTVRFRVFDGAKSVEKTAIDVFGSMTDPIDLKPAGMASDTVQVLMSSGSYVLGSSELNLTNLFILELVANDINEELILSTQGRLPLESHFKTRYLGTPVRRAYFKDLKTRVSEQVKSGFEMNSPIGQYFHIDRQIKMYADRLSRAAKLEAQLDAARMNNSFIQEGQDNLDNLFEEPQAEKN